MEKLTEGRDNWDLYLNDSGYVEAVATVKGCGNSVYGNISHFIKNLRLGRIEIESLTDYGKKLVKEEAEKRGFTIDGI